MEYAKMRTGNQVHIVAGKRLGLIYTVCTRNLRYPVECHPVSEPDAPVCTVCKWMMKQEAGERIEFAVLPHGQNTHIVSGRLNGEIHTNCGRYLNRRMECEVVEYPNLPMCSVCEWLLEQQRKEKHGQLPEAEEAGDVRRDAERDQV